MGSELQTGQLSSGEKEEESNSSDTQCQTVEFQKEIEKPGMSADKASLRWFRVYSADRQTRKAVGATSLKELISEAKKKLQIKANAKITIVLEEDGTVVDEEDYFQQGVAQNDILMVLKSDEIWTDSQLPLTAAEMDQDVPDSVGLQGNDEDDLRLRNLASRLRADLKEILLFSTSDCQLIVDANCDQLSRLLHRSRLEVENIQAACQTYIDQQADFRDACDVLKLAKEALTSGATRSLQSDSTDELDGPSRRKRKRT